MPFVLIIVGALFLIVGVRGTQAQLFSLIKGDFTGPGNFIYWVVAILIVGSIGYIEKAKPLSDAFLVLIIIMMFLSNKGFFNQFTSQINATTAPSTITPLNPYGLGSGGLFNGNGASANF